MLDVRWNAQSDVFYFLANPLNETFCTKRAVLSQIAKLFDPAGWLAPSIIITKMIMQQIWLDTTEWDEEISLMCMSRWQRFIDDFPSCGISGIMWILTII